MSNKLMRAGLFDTHLFPFLYNFRPGVQGSMLKWMNARDDMISIGYRPQVLCGGTSKMMGAGGGTTMSGSQAFATGAAPYTKTKFLADLLNARGIAANWQVAAGTNGLTSVANALAYDTRLSGGTNWITGNQTLAGRFFQLATPNTNTLTFSPIGTVDRVEIWYIVGTASGTFTVDEGGATLATISTTAGANGYQKSTVNLTRGSSKTINIQRTTANANPIHIGLIKAYDSQTPAIDIYNVGWFGSTIANWSGASSPWSPYNAVATFAADLFIHGVQANDLAQSTDVNTWKAGQKALLQQGLVNGSAAIVFETTGSSPTYGDAAAQAAYRSAAYAIADELDIPLIDEDAYFGNFTAANNSGRYADTIHENKRGNGGLAKIYGRLLEA